MGLVRLEGDLATGACSAGVFSISNYPARAYPRVPRKPRLQEQVVAPELDMGLSGLSLR